MNYARPCILTHTSGSVVGGTRCGEKSFGPQQAQLRRTARTGSSIERIPLSDDNET